MTFVRAAGILRPMPRPIRASVSAAALAHNLTIARQHAGAAKIWAVVKANAYGHGLLRTAQALRAADGFAMLDFADEHGFDFTTNLQQFDTKVLFAYSEFNKAYGPDWAHMVGDVFPHVEYFEVKGSGHELLYFGWNSFYPVALTYLNELK